MNNRNGFFVNSICFCFHSMAITVPTQTTIDFVFLFVLPIDGRRVAYTSNIGIGYIGASTYTQQL